MAIKKLKMRLTGLAPLIMHSGLLSDPLYPLTKQLKAISSKRDKTDADHEQMAKIEFIGGLYMGSDGPIVPAENIEAVLIEGAKKLRSGPEAKAGIYCTDHAQLIYDGPRDAESLWADTKFRNRVGVRIQKARIIRTRPIFRDWSLAAEIEYEDSITSESKILSFAKRAGAMVGLGDWRPRYGRFAVEIE